MNEIVELGFGFSFCLLMGLTSLAVAACMLSSRISQIEEEHDRGR